jgi:hypothetical protein
MQASIHTDLDHESAKVISTGKNTLKTAGKANNYPIGGINHFRSMQL